MTEQNIERVKKVYAAFGKGDIATIIDMLAENVDWASAAESSIAPWHGVHKGKGEVPKFFEALDSTIEVTEFRQLAFASNDTDVMTVSRFSFRVRANGKQGGMDIHHWWRFNDDGKIEYYRGTEDTALTAQLLSP